MNDSEQLVSCPICNGRGVILYYGPNPNRPKPDEEWRIEPVYIVVRHEPCYLCNETGKTTQEKADEFNRVI